MSSDARHTLRAELRALIALAWPIAAAQAASNLMEVVDVAALGRASPADLAGMSVCWWICGAVFMPAFGMALALESLATQAVGAGEPERAWQALQGAVRCIVALWAPLVAVAYAVTFALRPLGVDVLVVSRARDYLITMTPGMGLSLVWLAGKIFLQAQAATRPPLVATIAANLVNLVVCNLLVRGDEVLLTFGAPTLGLPRLGALGAGIAFTVAQSVLVLTILPAILSYRPARSIPSPPYAAILRVGIPVALHGFSEVGAFALAALLIARFGAASASAYQIVFSLVAVVAMGGVGVGGAAAVRVGHAVGAKASPRTQGVVGLATSAVLMGIAAIAYVTMPSLLMRAFTPNANVIAVGADLLVIGALFQISTGVQSAAACILRGAGDVRFTFLASVGSYWAVSLPMAFLFGVVFGGGIRGFWWGLTLGMFIMALTLVIRFLAISKSTIVRA